MRMNFAPPARAVFGLASCAEFVFALSNFFFWAELPYWFSFCFIMACVTTLLLLNEIALLAVDDLRSDMIDAGIDKKTAFREARECARRLDLLFFGWLGLALCISLCCRLDDLFFIFLLGPVSTWVATIVFQAYIQVGVIERHLDEKALKKHKRRAAEEVAKISGLQNKVTRLHDLQDDLKRDHAKEIREIYTWYQGEWLILQAKFAEEKCDLLMKAGELDDEVEQLRGTIRSLETEKEGWTDVAGLEEEL